MTEYHISKNPSFFCVGLNYQKADAATRGLFSLPATAVDQILAAAKAQGLDSLLVVSTCNRTELYGFAPDPYTLVALLCAVTQGSVADFQEVSYIHKNKEAIHHLFRVGTGLDSQILGDFEIIAQIKKGFTTAKKFGLANPFMERLCNAVIQASKRIKNETDISTGATSVAFASVQYILKHVPEVSDKNILLFGTGKIGRNTCENLIKHTKNSHITLINRTKDTAEKVAGKFNVLVKDYGELPSEIRKTDILVVATGAQKPTVSKALIHHKRPLLILDLSIPQNVSPDVTDLENVRLVHLDELSQITDDTLDKRREHIPAAEEIIGQIEGEFHAWLETRKFSPVIKALKNKLKTMQAEELDFMQKKSASFNAQEAQQMTDRMIQKITKQFAEHLKEVQDQPEQSVAFIESIFQLKEEIHG
ncbi:MAG: glutamyl-tRNA reductase [Flavobacteriia bacterium]|nr:glutamyl-tRNA reductase [Flavobacteriia bacterium]